MVRLRGPGRGTLRYVPGRAALGLAVAAMTGAWLLTVGGFAVTLLTVLQSGRGGFFSLMALCIAPLQAIWSTRQVIALHRLRAKVTAPILMQRRYGNLTAIQADDSRSLRSVGLAPAEAAERTDALLTRLSAIPSVRLFRGVQPSGFARPIVPHAVSAGRLLILVESVAWPPGFYSLDDSGRVHCDGEYVGQTADALTGAVRSCRALLPYTHRVSALVVVHPTGDGRYTLPAPNRNLSWALAEDVPAVLARRLAQHPFTVSRHTIAVLTSVPELAEQP